MVPFFLGRNLSFFRLSIFESNVRHNAFATSFRPFLFSALLYKNNPDVARTKSLTSPAADGEAASVNAFTPPFRHLVCRPIRHRIFLSIAPFFSSLC